MFLHVTQAKYIEEYKVWLSFNDGAEGEIDLASELYGEVFEPLKDKAFLSRLPWRAIRCPGAMALILLQSFCGSISPNKAKLFRALGRTETNMPVPERGVLSIAHTATE